MCTWANDAAHLHTRSSTTNFCNQCNKSNCSKQLRVAIAALLLLLMSLLTEVFLGYNFLVKDNDQKVWEDSDNSKPTVDSIDS